MVAAFDVVEHCERRARWPWPSCPACCGPGAACCCRCRRTSGPGPTTTSGRPPPALHPAASGRPRRARRAAWSTGRRTRSVRCSRSSSPSGCSAGSRRRPATGRRPAHLGVRTRRHGCSCGCPGAETAGAAAGATCRSGRRCSWPRPSRRLTGVLPACPGARASTTDSSANAATSATRKLQITVSSTAVPSPVSATNVRAATRAAPASTGPPQLDRPCASALTISTRLATATAHPQATSAVGHDPSTTSRPKTSGSTQGPSRAAPPRRPAATSHERSRAAAGAASRASVATCCR